ncbi:hypothetical protein IQ06DRAFT_320360 [Phaeosphaeriaceae sp. SRC1lsM3a]|nr:hypothetical protein IQ06DRAFT_320360 [Stagonospora sp. SRC1lsM3a]
MSSPTPPKSNRGYTPPKVFTHVVRSMHMRRNAPPPIPIPSRNAHPSRRRDIQLLAVEISNYSPSLTRHDVTKLFRDFVISPHFKMAGNTRFAYPLRTIIWISGPGEANRAVKELDRKIVGSRQIHVALAEWASHEQKEVVVAELADELKIAIISMSMQAPSGRINTLTSQDSAHSYYPHLTQKIIEVREHIEGATHYAFLQARDPTTGHIGRGGDLLSATNMAKWELVAGGRADSRNSQGKEENGRLGALKSLQRTVEDQGSLNSVWGRWNGSCTLGPVVSSCNPG